MRRFAEAFDEVPAFEAGSGAIDGGGVAICPLLSVGDELGQTATLTRVAI
jgi:hypothetical protein